MTYFRPAYPRGPAHPESHRLLGYAAVGSDGGNPSDPGPCGAVCQSVARGERRRRMATSAVEKSGKKKTEKKLAAREEAKLLAGFMSVMNSMRKQVGASGDSAGTGRDGTAGVAGPGTPGCPSAPGGARWRQDLL